MKHRGRALFVALAVLAPCAARGEPAAVPTRAGDAFSNASTIVAPDVQAVERLAIDWLLRQGVEKATLDEGKSLWKDVKTAGALDALVATLALGDGRIRDLADVCTAARSGVQSPDFQWLAEQEPLVRDNLRLHYGRWLARNRCYDEALAQLSELQPNAVVEPATLLFYQAVSNHRLARVKPGLKAVSQLLDEVAEADCPVRYRSLASLMQADLEAFKAESLDHASRLMDDVERRLDLGRTGQTVRKVEDDVVAILDKLIEEEEKKQGT